MSSTYKNCLKCSSNKIVKIGFQSGRRIFILSAGTNLLQRALGFWAIKDGQGL